MNNEPRHIFDTWEPSINPHRTLEISESIYEELLKFEGVTIEDRTYDIFDIEQVCEERGLGHEGALLWLSNHLAQDFVKRNPQ